MVLKFIVFSFVFLVHMSMSMGLLCKEKEREALLSLNQGFRDESGLLSSWGSGENQYECCKWEAISCNNQTGHVLKLDLRDKDLAGMISPSLAELHHLNYLDLSGNDFDVSWHSLKFIGSLIHLKYFNLSNYWFEGQFHNEFGNLTHLQYLDLGGNNLDGEFPTQLMNLSHLKHLDLSYNNFHGVIPHQLSNLSCLQYLYIGYYPNINGSYLRSNLEWVPYLSSSLTTLKLQSVDLSINANNWLELTSNLPLLKELMLSHCNLSNNVAPLSFSTMNISHFLTVIDISYNNLTSSIFDWMSKSLWDICNLSELHLSYNKLSGQLQDFVSTFPQCKQKSLKILKLDHNQISGTLPTSIGHLSELEWLSISKNSLKGIITEAHFTNLSKLIFLDLSYNALVLNISADWVPPFQLESLYLNSIKVGPYFPMWLRTQKDYYKLGMSGSQIFDTIPHWFWSLSTNLKYLDLSCNHIRGEIPNLEVKFFLQPEIDLSSNLFIGQIPSFLIATSSLHLNDNKFTNSSLFLCTEIANDMSFLNLSNNQLSKLSDCWKNFKSLSILDLSNNKMSMKIPASMGFLFNIQVLFLRNNNLTGEIPLSLGNCKELTIFDVSYNKLFGAIPAWIGDKLQKLVVLILKFNQFYGSLPMNICSLDSLQILDLSHNNISGSIPKCVNKLTAMASQTHLNSTIEFLFSIALNGSMRMVYDASIMVTWKRKNSEYKRTLGLLRIIDLSSNRFEGEIPSELMDLIGLQSLNISRNMLCGYIPSTVGQLKSLEVLDLSRNFLSGTIPSSLSELSFLSMLDLAYNKLSGPIPKGTQIQSFDVIFFIGNPELCGAPLPKICLNEVIYDGNDNDDNHILDKSFYISMAIGFVVGFWGICGSLCLNKPWRYAYFKFLRDIYNWIYVLMALNIAKLQRRFNGFKD